MALILDHINGIADDNRIENLRIVCPNCAATLDTHCGRQNRLERYPRKCRHCDGEFYPAYASQRYCSRYCGIRRRGDGRPRPERRKVERPPDTHLLREVDALGYTGTGRRYGVSDNAIRKWLRQYERELASDHGSARPGMATAPNNIHSVAIASPTVLILAAGQGTRMRSQVPKVLHEICGRAMICWPVQAALEAGAGKVVVVESPTMALGGVLGDEVTLAVQPQSNGTGGAVIAAAEHIDRGAPVVILSGDVPLLSAQTIEELLQAHRRSGAGATLASTVLEDPSGYGRVVRDEHGAFERVVETKTGGDASDQELTIAEINSGVYVFDGGALLDVLDQLSSDNAQGELYLPQALDLLRAKGITVAAHRIDDQRLVLGVNDLVQLAHVRSIAQRAINERHMRAGVRIADPGATLIDVDVEIGPDTTIEPFTTIHGQTRIGSGCTIRHSYIVDCVLEDGVSVGPFAYLRPGTLLRQGAKVGTFVEVKNSDLGAGAKVPHLSYIGDADIGEQSNLGAGTLTANYDGVEKHRTTIGSRVRGGVDTAFVAPVTVGDDATTAAGSVITEDVPPGALAIARARQKNLEDYAERRKRRS
jgi:bifunctional UDP-N-acetylglucosamine pyrophosphorylase / glucosamine-1-phosphate N-acetyltransferase